MGRVDVVEFWADFVAIWVEKKLLAAANIDYRCPVRSSPTYMQELWRLKNDLPAYLSTAADWLSSMELDRNDTWPTIHGEGAALLALQRPQEFPAWGRLACAFALDGTLLYRRRAHIFALQPHVRRRRPS